MSATPTKVCKRGRKPKKKKTAAAAGVNFTSGGRRASGRKKGVGLILAECYGSIGFPLTREAGQHKQDKMPISSELL